MEQCYGYFIYYFFKGTAGYLPANPKISKTPKSKKNFQFFYKLAIYFIKIRCIISLIVIPVININSLSNPMRENQGFRKIPYYSLTFFFILSSAYYNVLSLRCTYIILLYHMASIDQSFTIITLLHVKTSLH